MKQQWRITPQGIRIVTFPQMVSMSLESRLVLLQTQVCICVCVYVFTCFHLWMCMCAVVHVCVCMDVCVCLLLCVCVCCSVCTYVCVCGCVCFFLLFSVKAIMNLWKSLAKRRLIFKNNSSFRIE